MQAVHLEIPITSAATQASTLLKDPAKRAAANEARKAAIEAKPKEVKRRSSFYSDMVAADQKAAQKAADQHQTCTVLAPCKQQIG